ncbi:MULTISPECIES: VOC family protein [unclassified Leisingera]|uniref:VOC family protein n=1 Tax=unclassified Leisingera TaxID=2614906 RepID=UPI0002E3AE49|nr:MULTISPECIES: VOC family protein [unclassified Leisingera]KIC19434.1 bleomycin resistance protein [Leisingera sp. ANG-DT]KIC25213.1 bleomycin resistance protein [Leisingera sp. ANG-S3]KIC27437.1 bleomycin resistance protein [Leisingera sp. ANG-M6]KIC33823.1 bleomycin resistance protein [Leisingera sp. ANG-S5]KIC54735.1 bleomycin resistance protein [Leisingera sp. ANG-S]
MLPQAPAPQAILEAALYVDDLDAAEDFYGRILGLQRIQKAAGRHVFFRCGSSVLLLFIAAETAKPPGNPRLPVPPHGAQGPGHVCFAQSRSELLEMRDRLHAAGVDIEAEFDWPHGPRSIYFRDPAGNSVEISEPHLWSY